jgi:hypothetical protein
MMRLRVLSRPSSQTACAESMFSRSSLSALPTSCTSRWYVSSMPVVARFRCASRCSRPCKDKLDDEVGLRGAFEKAMKRRTFQSRACGAWQPSCDCEKDWTSVARERWKEVQTVCKLPFPSR